ncbi:MAG: hypothetical protein IPO58_24730 [Betaproteobacteria bacterium]|nr:hypothetical protein [Betaproteobacteria bacterium]
MHYLRSMGNWGGFVDSPQEFFAGTSGQWFTDSWLTVRLGLARALQADARGRSTRHTCS